MTDEVTTIIACTHLEAGVAHEGHTDPDRHVIMTVTFEQEDHSQLKLALTRPATIELIQRMCANDSMRKQFLHSLQVFSST